MLFHGESLRFTARIIAILTAAVIFITGITEYTVFATDMGQTETGDTPAMEENEEDQPAPEPDEESEPLKVDIRQKSAIISWKSSKSLTLAEDSSEDVVWTSAKSSIASVTQDGKVKGVRPGSTTIVCRSRINGAVYDKCKVKVKVKAVYLAHKGYSAKAPENTIPAIKRAVKAGFSGVEIDIFESKKEKSRKYKPFILVCHDSNLKKLTGKSKKITKLTHKSYKKYKIKKHVHGKKKYGAQKIPTLTQAVKTAWKAADKKGKKNFIVELDIKQKNISRTAVKSIIKLAGDRRVRINSPHFAAIKRFKRYRKSENTELWVYKNSKSKKKTWKFIKRAARLKVDGVSMPPGRWTKKMIKYCKKHNLKMATKTESRKTAKKMIKKGFERVCTGHKLFGKKKKSKKKK